MKGKPRWFGVCESKTRLTWISDLFYLSHQSSIWIWGFQTKTQLRLCVKKKKKNQTWNPASSTHSRRLLRIILLRVHFNQTATRRNLSWHPPPPRRSKSGPERGRKKNRERQARPDLVSALPTCFTLELFTCKARTPGISRPLAWLETLWNDVASIIWQDRRNPAAIRLECRSNWGSKEARAAWALVFYKRRGKV